MSTKGIELHAHQVCTLSQEAQMRLRKLWNARLRDPLAFVPREERERVTRREAKRENEKFGKFAGSYLGSTIRRLEARIDNARSVWYVENATLAMIGFGRGYDCTDWLPIVTRAGLRTICVDVSDVACAKARKKLRQQFEGISAVDNHPMMPLVVRAEIQTLLEDIDPTSVCLEKVELWYLSRLIGCLEKDSAEIVLREIGDISLSEAADPEKKKAVVIINALQEHNPGAETCTSTLYSKADLLGYLSVGAGRDMKACFEEQYEYFRKKVTAMTILAA